MRDPSRFIEITLTQCLAWDEIIDNMMVSSAVLSFSYAYLALPSTLEHNELLKHIFLDHITLMDRDVDAILSRCPLLTSLQISVCTGLANLNIHHSELLSLSVADCLQLKTIDLSCINISKFEYYGEPVILNFVDVPNMKDVYCIYQRSSASPEGFVNFYARIPDLCCLSTNINEVIQATFLCTLPNHFDNLVELTLASLPKLGCDLLWLITLLEAVPSLERFTVGSLDPVGDKELETCIPRPTMRQHRHLCAVELCGFTGSENELNLVVIIFQIAASLVRMVIHPNPRCFNPLEDEYVIEVDASKAEKARKLAYQHLAGRTPLGVELVIS